MPGEPGEPPVFYHRPEVAPFQSICDKSYNDVKVSSEESAVFLEWAVSGPLPLCSSTPLLLFTPLLSSALLRVLSPHTKTVL